MHKLSFRKIDVDGFNIFYREAGSRDAPAVLLLHGFPSAGHMFRDLIPQLSDRFRVIAPDLPGFGQSDMPDRGKFTYTFDNIARLIDRFTEVVGLDRFAIYVFDYGAPTGFRLATWHPERIAAIISQNGNAYVEGLSECWQPIRAYWEDRSQANRAMHSAPSWRLKRLFGNTRTACLTRPWSLRTATLSTISIWPGLAPTRCNSTCSVTTRATSRSIRSSTNIFGRT